METVTEADLTARIDVVLVALDPPSRAFDGDCLAWAPRVTEALTEAGFDAVPVTVSGWVDAQVNLLGFVHVATAVADVIVDVTATQFHQQLPSRWVTPVDTYCRELAAAVAIGSVTVTRR